MGSTTRCPRSAPRRCTATASCAAIAERPRSLHAMFAAACARAPHAYALSLRRRARELRAVRRDRRSASPPAWRRTACAPASACVMFIDNRPEFVFVLLALPRLGAIAVPVGVREQRPGLAYIARQCGAIGDRGRCRAGRAPARCATRRRRCSCAWRSAAPPGCVAYDALLAHDAPHRRAGRAGRDRRRGDPLHLGHHRQPEGRDADAPEHRALGAALPGVHEAAARASVSALAVPASHVTGLIAIIATMLHVAGTTVIVPRVQGRAVHRADAARARDAHADGAGDVQPVPAAARLRAGRPERLARRRLRRRADAGEHDRRAGASSCPASRCSTATAPPRPRRRRR